MLDLEINGGSEVFHDLDEVVRSYGFKDAREFHRLVASLDLSTPERVAEFKRWQHGDATKAGLLEIIARQRRRKR